MTFLARPIFGGGVAAGSQSYTAAGSYTWVAPAGVTSVSVVAVGGGGGQGSNCFFPGAGGGGTGGTTYPGQSGGTNGGDGTANTGGGGGGGAGGRDARPPAGNGGSGIVIIAYPGAVQQATGGSVTITGGYVYHKFTNVGTSTFTW